MGLAAAARSPPDLETGAPIPGWIAQSPLAHRWGGNGWPCPV